jgi:hypothetical protein
MATFRYSRKAASQFLPGWGSDQLLLPSDLFPFPRSSLLSTSPNISANSLALPCSQLPPSYHPFSCASCSVDHLLCSPSDISTVHQSKQTWSSRGFSLPLCYRQQGQSFPSSNGAIPCRLPFESHTPITFVVVGHESACSPELLTFASHIQSHWPSRSLSYTSMTYQIFLPSELVFCNSVSLTSVCQSSLSSSTIQHSSSSITAS